MLADVLHVPMESLRREQLLVMPASLSDNSDAIDKANAIRKTLRNIPSGYIVVGDEAFEQVQACVPPSSWKTRWFELPENQYFAAMLVYSLIMIFFLPLFIIGEKAGIMALGIVIGVLGLVYIAGYFAGLFRAWKIAKYDQLWQNPDGLSHGYVAFSALIIVGTILQGFL